MSHKALAVALIALALSVLACRTGPAERRTLNLYPTETREATQTPIVVEVERTVIVVHTSTPRPIMTTRPTKEVRLCVTATEAVYLRPSPSTKNYPIVQLENGAELVDLGGRDGNWMFVQWKDKSGWVNRKYVKECQ